MNQMQEEFYQVMTRLRANSRAGSSTPATPLPEPRVWYMENGVIVSKPLVKEKDPCVSTTLGKAASTPDRITKETIQTSEGPAVVTKYHYDNTIPSNTDQVYKCGSHDFETKNLTEFNRHIESHGSSKAASVSGINKVKTIHDFIFSNGKL